MKKNFSFLMLIFIGGILPLHAAEPQKSYARIAKEKAAKQFNDSYDRFKRCIHGNCTKIEALKVARDLGAAALLLITVMYGAGAIINKTTYALEKQFNPDYPYSLSPKSKKALITAGVLQSPVYKAKSSVKKLLRPKINVGDTVLYKNNEWTVTDKYANGDIIIREDISGGTISVPGHKLTKIRK